MTSASWGIGLSRAYTLLETSSSIVILSERCFKKAKESKRLQLGISREIRYLDEGRKDTITLLMSHSLPTPLPKVHHGRVKSSTWKKNKVST